MAFYAFNPTDEQRMQVRIMCACGFPQEQICERVIDPRTGKKISDKTLRKAFRAELDAGTEAANAIVAQSLFKKATGNGPQSVTAAIFWLKSRAGWKTTEGMELTGKDGAPLPGVPALSEAQFEKLARKISKECEGLDKEF